MPIVRRISVTLADSRTVALSEAERLEWDRFCDTNEDFRALRQAGTELEILASAVRGGSVIHMTQLREAAAAYNDLHYRMGEVADQWIEELYQRRDPNEKEVFGSWSPNEA